MVFASDNLTGNIDDTQMETDSIGKLISQDVVCNESMLKSNTKIKVNNINSYYNEKNTLTGYLKDTNDVPIKNRQLNVFLNGKIYNRTTDDSGKITLNINLKPNEYSVVIKFAGDEEYNSSEVTSSIKIKKAPLILKTNNYQTYVDSDLFFKAKVYNKVTNAPMKGIKVLFNVYSLKTKKVTKYFRTTDKNGVAELNKNLKVGSYKITAQIRDSKNKKYISYKNSNKKVTMKVKPTAETGCCSFYLQVSSTESVAGFRRDATNALNIYIKNVKWHGRTAIKQYKLGNSYFFHSITTSDGWMVGTGGIDNPSINKAIENLAGKMVEENKIKTSYLKQIQNYEKRLGLGHFSIKAPDGRYAVVWLSGYATGKLNAGEYISVPNSRSCYRHGTFDKFNTDSVKAAVKVGATDSFGVNRRDITVFHWKSTTDKYFKTTSMVKTYASNDNGKSVGRSTSYLKDDIYYKNQFISKNKLPNSPNMKFLGTHKFGNIDELIKIPTVITAPNVTNPFNKTKYFKVTVKNKNTKKVISNLNIKIKVFTGNKTKVYTVKTDKNGVAKLDTKNLLLGKHKVLLRPANNKYLISAESEIKII